MKLSELYLDYFQLTGDAKAAATLVHAQILSSLDETVLSIYEDAKSTVGNKLIRNFLGR